MSHSSNICHAVVILFSYCSEHFLSLQWIRGRVKIVSLKNRSIPILHCLHLPHAHGWGGIAPAIVKSMLEKLIIILLFHYSIYSIIKYFLKAHH